jgi:hypothetical protein
MAWQEVIADAKVWVHEYSVPGYSQVNAFAVLLSDGNLAIISPPTQMSEADFAAIDDKGDVIALIAPHSGHDLGQAEWQAQYSNAQSYAPTAALKPQRHTSAIWEWMKSDGRQWLLTHLALIGFALKPNQYVHFHQERYGSLKVSPR